VTSNESNRKRKIEKSQSSKQHSGSSFTMHRGGSNSSAASIGTAGNNTSSEAISNIVCESPLKMKRISDGNFAINRSSNNKPSSTVQAKKGRHIRSNSSSSTASSLSFGGLSMGSCTSRGRVMNSFSYDNDDSYMQQKKAKHTERREKDSVGEKNPAEHREPMNDSRRPRMAFKEEERDGASPLNTDIFRARHPGSPISKQIDSSATPVSKNTGNNMNKGIHADSLSFSFGATSQENEKGERTSSFDNGIDASLFPTVTRELKRHLRGESFTPLHHVTIQNKEGNMHRNPSPEINPGEFEIAPQISWDNSSALADLEFGEEKVGEQQATLHGSASFEPGHISPIGWKPEETKSSSPPDNRKLKKSKQDKNEREIKSEREFDDLQLTLSSPDSLEDDDIMGGKTTPLPFFFGQRPENEKDDRKPVGQNGTPVGQNGTEENRRSPPPLIGPYPYGNKNTDERTRSQYRDVEQQRSQVQPPPLQNISSPSFHHQGTPPTPLSGGPHWRDGIYTIRSRRENTPQDYQSPRSGIYGPPHMPGANQGDRVRNLRGRAPPHSPHHSPHHGPPTLHMPPHIQPHQHYLTSPIGASGFRNMMSLSSPHHSAGHPAFQRNPHLSSSKRKCVPLKTPIPSKFQGDIDKMKSAQVPEFTSLVNFPSHMSQKQSHNLPDGMRCCVMCGHACACSAANKNKKNGKNIKSEGGNEMAPLGSNGQSGQGSLSSPNGTFAIIPTQNKGLCTHCDVNVWVVTTNGLEIKWCKGCKNFRPWAAFGEKGLATKCVRCRERQREKYAAQKNEKEKNKALARAKTTAPKVRIMRD